MKSQVLKEIRDLVESEFGFDIGINSRQRKFVSARAVYYKLAHDKTNATITEISRSLDRHHATVLHGFKLFETFSVNSEYFKYELAVYNAIEKELTKNPIKESTILESIQEERRSILEEKNFILDKYNALKDKHNNLLRYMGKYEKNLLERYEEL
jgi:hypothetical protein